MRVVRKSRRLLALVAVGLSVACALAGCQSVQDDGGGAGAAADGELKIGGTFPLSGPNAALGTVGLTVAAVFKAVNDEGGINGRKIDFTYYDDAGNPARVFENARRLVEQDHVLGLFGTVGNTYSGAILDYVQQRSVPQMFTLAGGSEMGKWDDHPWTTTFYPGNATEGVAHARFVTEKNPDAKIAILATNDDGGQSYIRGVEQGIEGTNASIVSEQTYEFTDATVDSQVAKMEASGADTLLILALPKFAALALQRSATTGWKPTTVVAIAASSVEATLKPAGLDNVQGIYSALYLKDPADPQWADDPDMTRYREVLEKYGQNLDPNNSTNLVAYTAAMAFVDMLKGVDEPTAESLNGAAHSYELSAVPGFLPEVVAKVESDDPWAVEKLKFVQFKGSAWEETGDVVDLEGQTPQ